MGIKGPRNRKQKREGHQRRRLILGSLGSIGVLAMLLGAWSGNLIAQQQSRAGAIRVVLQPSDIARQRGNQVARTTAEKNMSVLFQDVLETGVGGRMRARLDDGSVLAVGPQSRLTVVEHNTETQQTTLQLEYGKVRAQVVPKTRPDAKFEVRTNTAVAGVLGTDEVVDASNPVTTAVLCIDGRVGVRNSDVNVVGTVILNPGEITFVAQGVVPTPPRPATAQEIQAALEGSGGATPEAVADVGTGFVTAGEDLTLSAADSFVTGNIVSYQWVITRETNNQVVYNQTQADSELLLDTTQLPPGNYTGTLTITTSNNETATTNFGFVVLPSELSNTSPELVIQQMQLAYETLQPNEFMKLFDPVKYSGYAALQQSVEASFRNLSQARVYVRRASGQIFAQGHVAIYQVDFEIRFSTKAEPDKTYVTREQATLRMESGSGWLITDVPQGQLGGGGLLAIPGVGNPQEVNSVPVTGNPGTGVPNIVPQGNQVVVVAGGSNTFEIKNTSNVPVTISFDPPPGITVTGAGVVGTTFTIPAGGTLVVVIAVDVNQPAGTVIIATSVMSGNSTLPGPTIPVIVQPPPPAPAISSFLPTSGLVGAAVTITGTNFSGATSVLFNGTSATFNVDSGTQISTTVPAGATTGSISVTTPSGTGTSASDFTVLTPPPPPPPAPIISSFLPTSGQVGASVVITGTNFSGATSVLFNGTSATFNVDSDTQISTTVPTSATTGPISVTTPAGTGTSGSDFIVLAPPSAPTISSFLPTSGLVGANVTIIGQNFTGATSVLFNGTSATFNVDSATQISTTVPTGATTGPISVTTPAGPGTSGSDFTVLTPPPPVISSFQPVNGLVRGAVVITGQNFTGATSVLFNGTSATFNVDSDTQISTTVPVRATSGPISITTPSGTGTSASDFIVLTLSPVPIISSFLPTSGEAGTSVTITGRNFTGATAVTFNGVAASFKVDSDMQVTAAVPARATTGLIAVTTAGGTGTSSTSFTVILLQRISGYGKQGVGSGSTDGKSGLVIAPESVGFTPLAPKPGDRVSIQARVDNRTNADAEGVKVGLLLNGVPAATLTVSIPAGGSQPVEFVWQAEYYQRLRFEISLQADGSTTAQTVPVRNLFVEPQLAGTFNQGRSELEITNGDCGGFRFVLGTQTFCGGSADLELSPVITGDGQLLVQAFSLNGGILDLGPQPITGQVTVPEAGYAVKGLLEPGRLYAVQMQGKYGLLYVSRIQSEIDPRLAKLTRGQSTQIQSLGDLFSDHLNDLLDRSRITVVVEWSYLENGSRRFLYGFSGVERGRRPGVIRQPRVPTTPKKQ